ncbi:hypothetical protein EDC01DRAFT_351408 [Geopyxis carbonaria]|nr:hypothetical protein EDC01DRAFT_351408 [Geopyxis carbonaria]
MERFSVIFERIYQHLPALLSLFVVILIIIIFLHTIKYRKKAAQIANPVNKPICIRVENIPWDWKYQKVVEILSLRNHTIGTCRATLSIYRSCSGDTQTALLNLDSSNLPGKLKGKLQRPITLEAEERINISVDTSFYGLTPLNSSEGETLMDIVAVTGLAGHAYGSWRNKESFAMWLHDFLPYDFKNCRIMTYGYGLDLKKEGRILDHAKMFLAQLNTARRSSQEKRRPIIFIGHSLGGILILQMLLHAKDDQFFNGQTILKATKGLILFGTPYQGMNVSALEDMVKDISTNEDPQRLLKQLEENSEFLERQRENLIQILYGLRICSFYELDETKEVKKRGTSVGAY